MTAALDEIRELMGEEKTRDLLAGVAADLRARFRSDRPEDLAFDAHTTISTAGQFGFLDLSDLCREIEEACRIGADVTLLRVRLNQLRRQTLREIEELLRAA